MEPTTMSILNHPVQRLPGPSLLHELVQPPTNDSIAIDYTANGIRTSLSYKQLHQASEILAERILHAAGTVEGQLVVPLLLHQSPLLYISQLAILKAGGAFCPLNIDAPTERVKFILKDVSAKVVLVSADLATGIPRDAGVSIIVVDEDINSRSLSRQSAPTARAPTPEDLAYVMYTSGSTGTPKGVGISHDAATQALLAHGRHIPPFCRFLQFAAPTFDVSVFEIFFPLFRGSTLVAVRRAELLNDLPAVLREMGVDACELTPTVAGSLLRKRANAPGLKLLLTIGEMLNAPVVEEFGGDENRPSMLWAMYGPTEATIHCTLQTAFSSVSSTGNIGVPLDTVSCFVIETNDSDDLPTNPKVLPIGEVGELAVGGFQLALGYLNRKEQTESVFIKSEYGPLYRTGDKARMHPDGTLECLGRLSDGQVKLRGQRLELGEVEQAVLRTSGCHSAVAAVLNSILVVFCAVDTGVVEDDILSKCREWLPQYMTPGEVILAAEFPRLPSGKVDKKKLKADYEAQIMERVEEPADTSPVDELEKSITMIVLDILGTNIQRSASLASAGMDSLKAIRLASVLRDRGFDLSSTSLLAQRTLADIVHAARRQPLDDSKPSTPLIISMVDCLEDIVSQNPVLRPLVDKVEDVTPCTPLQSAILAETAQSSTVYCNEIELELAEDVEIGRIVSSLHELALHNEVLRTGFATKDGYYVSILFKALREGQIQVVDDFEHSFHMQSPEGYLNPLQIQVRREPADRNLRLLVQLHHSIYDGWSMDILLADLSKLLKESSIPPRPSFRTVAGWYHTQDHVSFDAAKIFWTEHLQRWTKVPLPKMVSGTSGEKQIKAVRRGLQIPTSRLDGEVRKLGYSPQVLFQATLALMLSGISGTSDVVIGSVTSGRNIGIAGIEDIVGPCIASLPLRVDLSEAKLNVELLNVIHSANRRIMQHCILPLSEIKKLTGAKLGESLYDVLLVYQESLYSQERSHNLVKETRHLDRLETPLVFEVEPNEDGLFLQITYHENLFTPGVVENLVEQFDALSFHLLENLNGDMSSFQKQTIAHSSVHNMPPESWHKSDDLASAFEKAALEQPKMSAIRFATSITSEKVNADTLSYEELNTRANKVAWYLRSQDTPIGSVIAIIQEKSPSLYTSILGVVKARCAYLPILPSTPLVRIQEILNSANVRYCVVDSTVHPHIASTESINVINIDAVDLTGLATENLNIPLDLSQLAYVIYTSGTTGKPKGVAVTQDNIMANLSHLLSTYPKSSRGQGRLLQSCSQAFDVSVFEIFYTWHAGMCLCAGSNDTLFGDLEVAINQLDITHLSMTVTVASLVNPHNVPQVEFLVTAGEPMTQSVKDNWAGRLWQGYGPSETTNICSVKKMVKADHIDHLGYAFPNTSTVVLFPDTLQVVPMGWIGEFCFGGEQVAAGYLNMPELTKEKFIDHPTFGRLYRSGDLGRMLSDGTLLIAGRLDTQIKLRGQRIETGEINSTATTTGLAASAFALLVRQEKSTSEQLALFYVPRDNSRHVFEVLEVKSDTHQRLFASMHSHLPSYMVPSYLVPVSEIPLTPSGKVDHKRLQSSLSLLSAAHIESTMYGMSGAADEQEWSTVELSVRSIMAEITGTPELEIGRWTPFAMLGVDSISAIRVARGLSSQINTRVAVSTILQHPTVSQLARAIDEIPKRRESLEKVCFFPQSFVAKLQQEFRKGSLKVKEVMPCTPLQEAMLSRGHSSYFNKVLLRLHQEPALIRNHWETITRRHDILRTCFVTTNDTKRAIAQVVLDDWNIPWHTFDINEPSFDDAIQSHLRTLPEPVDSMIPPISLALLRYRGSSFLSLICHHALYDGVAMGNLWKEVELLCKGIDLPPPVPYRNFLQTAMQLPENAEEFWLEHLRGYQPSSLFNQTRSGKIDQSTHSTSLGIPLDSVHERLRFLGASLLSVCQATWASVLAIAHQRDDICFGNVVSGRTLDIEGLDRLVAPCFNTIPVRADSSKFSTNMDLVKHYQSLSTEQLRYQFTPLRLIQRLESRNSGLHLFDSLLLLQQPLQDIDDEIWTLEEDSGDMDMPLVCEIVPCPGLNSIVINIHHDLSSATGSIATTMADMFKHQLTAILESPHSTLLHTRSIPSALALPLRRLQPRQGRPEYTESLSSQQGHWNGLEKEVRQVLSGLSGVPESKIYHRTTIFQLGLDSINAVQIAATLRQKGYAISSSDVIECPTCAKIASVMQKRHSATVQDHATEYDFEKFSKEAFSQLGPQMKSDGQVEAILPCTPLQTAMITSFVQSGGDHYLNAVSYLVEDSISAENLAVAWKSLQRRHPMLRTGFIPVHHRDSSFAMVRYRLDSVSLPLQIKEESDGGDDLLARLKKNSGAAFMSKLQHPLFRVELIKAKGRVTMNVAMHHALYDAHSLQGLMRGLSQSIRRHDAPEFPEIEPALSSILKKSTDQDNSSKAFWESKASQVVVNKFPVMTPLRVEQRAVLSDTLLSKSTLPQLQQALQDRGVSIQAVVQAAWTRVLSSYLGESSVVFGVVLSGRTTEETKDAPFPCLNTVPVVAMNLPSDAAMVESMMEFNQSLHKHQFASLSQVQRWLGQPSGGLFDTLIAYQKTDTNDVSRTPWKLLKDSSMAEYPVSLEIEPTDLGQVNLCITYFNDVLPQEQARLMLRQFDATLHHLAYNPEDEEYGTFSEDLELLSILPAREPVMEAPVQLLHEFVEIGAKNHPGKAALEFVSGFNGDVPIRRTWNYYEFNCIGNKVANMLRKNSSPGGIIAIHFDKCPEAYFSILGILKAGCSFVALDPTAPKARKEFILKDSLSPTLLTLEPDTIDFQVDVPILSINEKALISFPEALDPLQISPRDTCYCLYTSGTTGTPKGCEITHENTVQAMMAFQELFKGHWEEDSRWLQFAALHFDVSVLEQYWSWAVGITVVAAPKDLVLDDLTGTISRLGITHIDLTPSLARLVHPDEVPSLCRGVFITGGEQLKQEILDVWGPQAVIYNAYGPTEATIGVTMYQRVPITGRPSNIGKQFPNVGSYIFQQGTETPVMRGGVGELCVSGKLVGKGYLNRPGLTDECFPTLSEFRERIYRTGDLVRVLHDGCFDFLGRADDQVKLRGQRLEIAEINHAIRSGVIDIQDVATIVARHGTSGKDVLVTFVVSQPSTSRELCVLPDAGRLGERAREACRDKLPGYMVPTYFLNLPRIPLSPNNKAEVKELKKLFAELTHEQLMELSSSMRAPISQLASENISKVIQALADFTGTNKDGIGQSTSIFDIGIDSITALRLSSYLRGKGFDSASPSLVLRNPIIADLACALAKQVSNRNAKFVREAKQTIQAYGHKYRNLTCRELNVKPSDIEYIAPCSPLQQGIISSTIANDDKGAYFNTFLLDVQGDVSIEKLKAAWVDLIASESILRTAFVPSTGGYIQVALKDKEIDWAEIFVDDSPESAEALQGRKERWIANNSSTISTPLTFVLCKHSGSRKLVVQIFHALYDGNSLELMLDRVQAIYQGNNYSQPPAFIEALAHGPLWEYKCCRNFWEEHLRNWQYRPTPSLNSGVEHSRAVLVTKDVPATALETVRSSQNVTLQAVVLALWTSVLRSFISNNVTTGVIASGRSIELSNVDGTIGPLFNTIPFFSRAAQTPTWASLINHCHGFNAAILGFQHVPLKEIQKWCSGGKSLFDNLFTFQVESANSGKHQELWSVEDGETSAVYPLALEAIYTLSGKLRLVIVAQGNVASTEELEKLLHDMEQAILSMSESVENKIAISSGNESELEGHQDDSSTQTSQGGTVAFEWAKEANTIRKEISSLVGTSSDEITENLSVLELGLDSIDVIKLSSKLKKFGVLLSPSQIMRHQTIANLVTELSEPASTQNINTSTNTDLMEEWKRRLWEQARGSELATDDVETVLPPTPLQESMVAAMMESEFESYFNHDILEVSEGVDLDLLEDAWAELVVRTPILRTSFYETDSQDLDMTYYQVVSKPDGLTVAHVQLQAFSQIHGLFERAKCLAKIGRATKQLLQLVFITIGNRNFVVISIAHALYDGWSLGLLYRNLQAIYKRKQITLSEPEPFLSRLSQTNWSDAKDFWARYLDGATPTILPENHKQGHGRVMRVEQPSKIALSHITDFCKRNTISLQVFCQACWALLLAQKSKALDVTFGVVLSGRDFEGAEDLMFPTMNTVALRCVLHGTVSIFLEYLEENMRDVRDYQSYPLRKAQMAANLQGERLFNTLFILQKSPGTSETKPLLTSIEGSSGVEYPVCVEAETATESLIWRVACQSQNAPAEGPSEFLQDLDRVASFLVTSNQQSDLFTFGEHGSVSICGLPSIQIQERAASQDRNSSVNPNDNNDVWDGPASIIREALHEVSQVPILSISKSDTLYHLGLDSISAIKVSSLLRKQGVNLRPREIIQAVSIGTMIELVGQQTHEHNTPQTNSHQWQLPNDVDLNSLLTTLGVSETDVEDVLPALPMQVYMLSAWQNAKGSVFFPEFWYQIPYSITLEKIKTSWRELVRQNIMLRTRFISTGRGHIPFLQVIMNDPSISMQDIFEHAALTTVLGPLAKLYVTQNQNRTWSLCLKIHHALYDGVSLPALLEQFSVLLNTEAMSAVPVEVPTQWKHFVTAPLSKPLQDSRQDFWKSYLGSSTVTGTDGYHSSGALVAERVSFLRTSAITDASSMRANAAKHGISIQAVFLAAYAKVLSSLQPTSTRGTILFGIYLANRSTEDNLRATYPTLNLVPIKVEVEVEAGKFEAAEASSPSLVDMAIAIQRDIHAISSNGNANVGLWEVAAWTGVKVHSFVNFLTLPSTPEEVSDAVKLAPVEREGATDSHDDGTGVSYADPEWIKDNAVQNDYPLAIDVEASISNSGLDIGVFASKQRISEDGAVQLVTDIVSCLERDVVG